MIIKINNEEIRNLLDIPENEFPKYAASIINLANQFAQGTRPKVVGQLSDLIQEFQGSNLEEWKNWYLNKYPDAIKNATDKIYEMIQKFKQALTNIDRNIIEVWVNDLVIVKTFIGLRFQEAILKKVAEIKKVNYRLSTSEEESIGIDGFIGNIPVSIKPLSYKNKQQLSEDIKAKFIYYEKRKNNIVIEFNF